jgi:hypothetical protein
VQHNSLRNQCSHFPLTKKYRSKIFRDCIGDCSICGYLLWLAHNHYALDKPYFSQKLGIGIKLTVHSAPA